MLRQMQRGDDRRRFTADQFERMGQVGILHEDDRVELIDGEIREMTAIGPPHAASVNRANQVLMRLTSGRALVSPQNPVRLNLFNEPAPDLVLLRPRDDFYRHAHPGPADILLIVEIADSSLRYDREVKGEIYARYGVVEYWLVDLGAGTVTSYSAPEDGRYRVVAVHTRVDALSPKALPDCSVAVADLL